MTKSPAPETATPPQSDVEAWIGRTGYPLELRAAKILSDAGFDEVDVCQYFDDPRHENQPSEVDVVASVVVPVEVPPQGVRAMPPGAAAPGVDPSPSAAIPPSRLEFRVTIVAECKYARARPWVVLCAERKTSAESLLKAWPSNADGWKAISSLAGLRENPVWTVRLFPLQVGHRIAEYQGDDQGAVRDAVVDNRRPERGNAPYYAVSNAITAAEARAKAARTGDRTVPRPEIVVPVVVVDGDLYEYSLTKGNKLRLRQVKRSTLIWSKWGGTRPDTIVPILTVQAVKSATKDIVQPLRILIEQNAPAVLASVLT